MRRPTLMRVIVLYGCLVLSTIAVRQVAGQPELSSGPAAAGRAVDPQGNSVTRLNPGRVRGQVLFKDSGSPAAHEPVRISWQKRTDKAATDADGRFEFGNIVDSKNYVSVWPLDARFPATRKLIEFTPDKRVQEITLELSPGIAVRGTVVDADTGAGLPKVTVRYVLSDVTSEDGSEWTPIRDVVSNSEGRFELFAPPGPAILQVVAVEPHPTHDVPDERRWREGRFVAPEHSARIDVSADKPLEGVRLAVGRGLVLRGRVVDAAGDPVPGALVKPIAGSNTYQRQWITDQDGRFELAGLTGSGKFTIRVMHEQRKLSGSAAPAVEPWTSLTRVVDVEPIRMLDAGQITGVVVSDGQPRAGVSVSASVLVPAGIPGTSNFDLVQTVSTGANGKFLLLVPAEKDLMVIASQTGFADANSRQRLRAGQTLELPPFEMRALTSFIAGVVVDQDGKPIPNATVMVTAVDAQSRYLGANAFGRTGPDGRFRLENLPKTKLRVEAGAPGIRIPVHVIVEAGQTDVRIVVDPNAEPTPPALPRRGAEKK